MQAPSRNQHPSNNTNHQRALTLLETAITITLAALTLAAMATTLQAAKNQSRSEVCLTNLKALGNAIYTYAAEYNNILPGPAYPALNHHQTIQDYEEQDYSTQYAEFEISRRLTTLLKNILGNNQTDKQITCPTMAAIVPDDHFLEYQDEMARGVWPTHYTLNNVSDRPIDSEDGGGATGECSRTTSPADYFGYSDRRPYSSSTTPKPLVGISNASREWMISDAWYRARNTLSSVRFLVQEGTFQWHYSGEPLPNFAPHMRRAGQSLTFIDRSTRNSESSRIRSAKTDGLTNTIFFDGHAAPVASRTATIHTTSGIFELLYGFPGTVNPWFSNSPNQAEVYERIWNSLIWE